MKSRRLKIAICDEELSGLIVDLLENRDSCKVKLPITAELPAGTVIDAISFYQNALKDELYLRVEHESFAIVPTGSVIPQLKRKITLGDYLVERAIGEQ